MREIRVQGPVDDGEQYIVHRAAERRAGGLDPIERQRADTDGARVARERTIHQRARRVEGHLVKAVLDLHPLQTHARQGPGEFDRGPGLGKSGAADVRETRCGVGVRAPWRPLLLEGPRRLEGGAAGRAGQGGVHAPHARHAVDEGMVHLAVDGKAVAFQALDHLAEPARPLAVQHAAVQAFDEVEQLARVAGRRQRRVAHVVIHVDVFFDLPLRHARAWKYGPIVERRRRRLRLHASDQLLQVVLRRARGQFEYLQRADVLRARGHFRQEEHRIQRGYRHRHVRVLALRSRFSSQKRQARIAGGQQECRGGSLIRQIAEQRHETRPSERESTTSQRRSGATSRCPKSMIDTPRPSWRSVTSGKTITTERSGGSLLSIATQTAPGVSPQRAV